jgi:hypothetical protein
MAILLKYMDELKIVSSQIMNNQSHCEGIKPWPNWSCPLEHMVNLHKQATYFEKFKYKIYLTLL